MSIRKNIFANYAGAAFTALVPILALPWYLAALGVKQWGLVSFVATLQAVLGLVDAGMSQALVRETAIRLMAEEDGRRRAATLLFGFERIYWGFAIIAALLTALMADMLAANWLRLGDLAVEAGRTAVYGAAAIFAAQFPGSLYRSVLVGAQKQVRLNMILIGGVLLRHGGGVVIVSIWPTLLAYLAWQAAAALAETVARGIFAWRSLHATRRGVIWDMRELRQAVSLTVGMSIAVLLGALTVQMDKIVLSRMVPVEQFGYYAIASSLALGVLQFIHPITQAMLPRVVQLHFDPPALRRFNFRFASLAILLMAGGALVYFFAGQWLLEIWLRDALVASRIYALLSVLLVGTALNALYGVGYLNWLAHGRMGRVLMVNGIALGLAVILIPAFVAWLGLVGAAFGWLVINGVGLLFSLEWLKRDRGCAAR